MDQKKRNPAAVAAACRVGDIEGFATDCDGPESTRTPPPRLAVVYLVRRFPLTEQRARLVAELSGLGGAR